MTWPRETDQDLRRFYGEVGTRQVELALPYPLILGWPDKLGVYRTINRMVCHALVRDSLRRIFERTLAKYGRDRIGALRLDVFGGCLNVRRKRGSTTEWSVHAWGAAVDLDPDRNRLRWGRDQASFAGPEYADFWSIVEEEGWVSLGRAKNYDWMHFQAAVPPPNPLAFKPA